MQKPKSYFELSKNPAHNNRRVMMAQLYRKKGTQPMFPWSESTDMARVSISDEDKQNGSPKPGDMIAFNPDNKEDRWLVAEEYFRKNYELAP